MTTTSQEIALRWRVSPFAIAEKIEPGAGSIELVDWLQHPRRVERLPLAANRVLNLFAAPSPMDLARAQSGLSQDEFTVIVEDLKQRQLLLREGDWLQLRERFPYMNLPSLHQEAAPARRVHSYEEAYQAAETPWERIPPAVDLIALLPDAATAGRLLDVGCGAGNNLRMLEDLGYHCYGIDIAPTAIAALRARASDPEHWIVASVTAMPWADAEFQTIMDVGCLHSLQPPDWPAYARETSRVLAPGGVLYCRALKPRNASNLAAQPVVLERLGVSPDEVNELLAPAFDVTVVKENLAFCYYIARKRE